MLPLLADVLPAMSHLRSLEYLADVPEPEVMQMIQVIQQCTQLTQLELTTPPHDQFPLFVPALASLTNLVELRLHSEVEGTMLPTFATLHFPHLKLLRIEMQISEADVSAFVDWLEHHPTLETLHLAFERLEVFKQVYPAICKCPALTSLNVSFSVESDSSFCLPSLPPTLRNLMWRGETGPDFLPKEHCSDELERS